MKPQKTARFMRSNQTMSTQAIYDVVEIFTSINGEGPLVGQLAVFIRMKGFLQLLRYQVGKRNRCPCKRNDGKSNLSNHFRIRY